MKYTELKEELSKHYSPVIKYLLENLHNTRKTNSNLDMTWENIHEIDSLIRQLQCYRKELNTFKAIIEDAAKQQDKGDDMSK